MTSPTRPHHISVGRAQTKAIHWEWPLMSLKTHGLLTEKLALNQIVPSLSESETDPL